ncbi:MAG: hypothetical protein WD552_01805, partial [Candidatus Paceibacterota bacterium]
MQEEIRWHAPEFITYEKGTDWYWAVGVIAITLAVAAILFGNILFALVIIIGTAALSMQASRDPEIREFAVGDRGVQVDGTLYPHSSIISFWVENNPHEQKLLLQSEKMWMPYIVMPIAEVDPEEVRNFLIEYLPEEEHQEPLS